MLLHRAYAAFLLLLLTYMLFQPFIMTCHQSPTKEGLCLKVLNNALVSNVRQLFADTKHFRDFRVIQMRKGMFQVLLNNHVMQQINGHKVSNTLISSHLFVMRKPVAKHRKKTVPCNKNDVKWKHSDKPGDHVHAYNEDRSTYTIHCTTGK